MAPLSEEDIEWFKSTFRPIPKPQLPEDCIQYSLHWIDPKIQSGSPSEADAARAGLGEVQKAASKLVRELLKDYIWQRDGFKLELTKDDGVNLLRGRTEYGDSIEDEWIIVYILRELTKTFPELWVKVTDSDGEFLLVEAAATLPRWLEPDIADNRVWIRKGQLVIIQPASLKAKASHKGAPEKLSFRDAKDIILKEPARLIHSQSIEDEAFYRLRNYPKQISENLHSALITVPRKTAHLLHLKPAYVSPAVEAFYLRDPISLRPLQSKNSEQQLVFPPDDLVTVSVKFTKVGYAQLKSQDFDPPIKWKGYLPPGKSSKEYSRAETGMKLACGFEMLLTDSHSQDKPAVREMKLVLEDIETGDEKLPTNDEIDQNWSKQDDSEAWMDISLEDLEGELKGKARGDGAEKLGAFGDKSAQENLQRIVAKFEEFLNDDAAGVDGADLMNEFNSDESDEDDEDDDSSDGEDHEASFDEDQFSKMMQEMMGLPPPSSDAPSSSRQKTGKVYEIEPDDGEDDRKQIEEMSRGMEAELREAGFFDQIKSPRDGAPEKQRIKGKAPVRGMDDNPEDGSAGISEDVDDHDIDVNLARNLLESLKSQGGAAGPGGNLLGLMGMKPPQFDRE